MTAVDASHLERLARQVQAEARVPALSVALHRADRPLWTFTSGVGADSPLDAGTQFRIGSVTKTFTAVLVMQCRDDGLLDLDDPIARHLDRAGARRADRPPAAVAHRRACSASRSATSGTRCSAPDVDQLLAELDRAERVLPPARRFHYSNLGIALLGHLVGRLRGGTWAEVLAERILDPAGPRPTPPSRRADAAVGYLVDAYSDHARPEPPTDFGAVAPGRAAVEHRRGPGPLGGVPGRPGGGGPGRRGAGRRPRSRRCAGR